MTSHELFQQLFTYTSDNLARITALESAIRSPTGDEESDVERRRVSYGTAGFRGRADKIAHLFYNVGLIAGLRCLTTRRSNLGIMITASHNPVEDNGVKIIESDGSMLEASWEKLVEDFCNMPRSCEQQIKELIAKLASISEASAEVKDDLHPGAIMLGRDSRPTSETLVQLVKLGLDAWAPLVSYKDYGQLTTPALHFLVGESSLQNFRSFALEDYYKKLANGLVSSFQSCSDKPRQLYDPSQIIVDNASGVGSLTMKFLCDHSEFKTCLPVALINHIDDHGVLNLDCGADFVKTKHRAPRNADQVGKRYASLDGDADRVVYFYLSQENDDKKQLHLLDGDKILALFARYLKEILESHQLASTLTLGVVQTAYANGSSTDYLIETLGLKVDCVDTGVKHLHKQALNYDFGLYFEANGHGTIYVSDRAKAMIANNQVAELQHLLSVLNNYTGDAISDILIVELILNHYDWDILTWDRIYADRPNVLTKVEIADRSVISTENAGRTCVSPPGLQEKIDQLVGQYGTNARSFVRASGTENVVRVYAEADGQEAASRLAELVGQLVIDMCNR